MGEEEPADDAADNVAGGQRNVDIECLDFGEPCRLKEDHRVAQDGVAAEDLSGPNDTVLGQD